MTDPNQDTETPQGEGRGSPATVLRIFSYLPNPRVWKALIAARLCGVGVELVGDKPRNLGGWLWDFDARPLDESERTEDSPYARRGRRGFSGTLYKTDEFLRAHPFGTVPAAFTADGDVGIFESNSILRAVARAGREHRDLYGGAMQASRVDSFLDAGLVFAREAQVYLLAMDAMSSAVHARMSAAYEFYLAGIDSALRTSPFLAGPVLSIADISFACDLAQFLRESHFEDRLEAVGLCVISADVDTDYPRAFEHLIRLAERDEFAELLDKHLEERRANVRQNQP